ncbi:hypothetical protein EVAR_14573_1 [Eumeta japonica]|uniref:Uncharacterized protein n=1 Tax=Eumeta variegata TaxID=151549 RepID=A0A4C1UVN2_EUMVA|nr:hypothetical protein EVAR_14573_1 [Eumeta japonica]
MRNEHPLCESIDEIFAIHHPQRRRALRGAEGGGREGRGIFVQISDILSKWAPEWGALVLMARRNSTATTNAALSPRHAHIGTSDVFAHTPPRKNRARHPPPWGNSSKGEKSRFAPPTPLAAVLPQPGPPSFLG